ncbi:hypothetical protein [Alkalihalobacterium elongatum]|uniref:hypothetical protein n=1 Tax=Alkalihalobacterium elongatum TaxID=2675466 RepID=UPI001C1FA74C|nr:hypothetical protein [Alkalihalobacterium elongatum]
MIYEYGYRAIIEYKREDIKQTYTAANRVSQHNRKPHNTIIKRLFSLISIKRKTTNEQQCCDVQCCSPA